jgi:hypothetical protein
MVSSSFSSKKFSSSYAIYCIVLSFVAFFIYFLFYSNNIVSKKEIAISTAPALSKNPLLRSDFSKLNPVQDTSNLVNMTMLTSIGIGSAILKVHPEWAPIGSKRFMEQVDAKFYNGNKFFRVIKVNNFYKSV